MPDKITFYAVIGGDRTVDNPYGLVRRLEFGGDGFTDEGLRKDFSWFFTPAIVEWKRGDLGQDLVEVAPLEKRDDLSAAYVERAARIGILNMPPITRGDVSNEELASIAQYLSKGKP